MVVFVFVYLFFNERKEDFHPLDNFSEKGTRLYIQNTLEKHFSNSLHSMIA